MNMQKAAHNRLMLYCAVIVLVLSQQLCGMDSSASSSWWGLVTNYFNGSGTPVHLLTDLEQRKIVIRSRLGMLSFSALENEKVYQTEQRAREMLQMIAEKLGKPTEDFERFGGIVELNWKLNQYLNNEHEVLPTEFAWAVAMRQGFEPDEKPMEDYVDVRSEGDWSFFGVYDGHSGPGAAQIAARGRGHMLSLSKIILNKLAEKSEDPNSILAYAFENMEKQIWLQERKSGTTAVVALMNKKDKRFYCAHTGDSRAIGVDAQGMVLFQTEDHRPNLSRERERIEAAGGVIVDRKGVERINGLAISRSIGDDDIKQKGPGIIATPDIVSSEFDALRYLILGCDGVWDMLSNEDITQNLVLKDFELDELDKAKLQMITQNIPKLRARLELLSPEEQYRAGNNTRTLNIASTIRDKALLKWVKDPNKTFSTDNITALVIDLQEQSSLFREFEN